MELSTFDLKKKLNGVSLCCRTYFQINSLFLIIFFQVWGAQVSDMGNVYFCPFSVEHLQLCMIASWMILSTQVKLLARELG